MINPGAILSHDFGEPVQDYDQRDAILYALGLGIGANPLDESDLSLLDERHLAVLPTFGVTLCTPGMWIRSPDLGVNFGKLVHSAQWAEFPNPLPAAGRVKGTAKVISLVDRGKDRGALLTLERTVADADSSLLYCRLRQSLMLRGDGGFGGDPEPSEEKFVTDRDPDWVEHFAVSPRSALIYRLSGDWNPLHLDPAVALAAGFPKPILHGLATYGIASIAASRALGQDPCAVTQLACRFASPVMPGDQLAVNVWRDGIDAARFIAFSADRKVLDAGEIRWRQA